MKMAMFYVITDSSKLLLVLFFYLNTTSLFSNTIMIGHENVRSYLHRLKRIGSPEFPCNHGIQTVDHLIFQCKRPRNERAVHLKRANGQ
jgi:hypothetical protein